MRLTERVFLVGSGSFGFSMTHELDCHVYLIDGGSKLALIDAGVGLETERILDLVTKHGFDLKRVKFLLLTHGHADHAGGAAKIHELLPHVRVVMSGLISEAIRTADEEKIGLTFGREIGFYPADYHLKPCPVEIEVSEGDTIEVGDCSLSVIETPGHSLGHISFFMKQEGKIYLFGGDHIFFGGQVLMQNVIDCSITDYSQSMKKLIGLGVDVLLPGHLCISLSDGQRHIDAANEAFGRLGIPKNIL